MYFSNHIFLIFLITFVLCALLTRMLITTLPKIGLVDVPTERKQHKKNVPRGGGIAPIIAFSIGFLLIDHFWFQDIYTFKIILPLWAIGLISIYDDIGHVNVLMRLALHLMVASYIVYTFLFPRLLFHGELPRTIDFIMTIIVYAGFMNIYNFMDGMDGMTVSQSAHLSITILIITYLRYDVIIHADLVCAIALLVLACSMAFAIYNWHPAHIFLGDVGSVMFGLLLGFALMLIAASAERLFVSSVIASMYYLSDGGMTLLIRALSGERVWEPHLKHFFQQAIRKRMPQRKIIWEILLCNYWLMVLAIGALFYPVISLALAILIVTRLIVKFSEKR